MISDTLRQRFLYSVPFADDGFPLVVLDDRPKNQTQSEIISGTDLYFWEKETFERFVDSRRGRVEEIVIGDDLELKSGNKRLSDGLRCYLMAFAYRFKKSGFRCSIR